MSDGTERHHPYLRQGARRYCPSLYTRTTVEHPEWVHVLESWFGAKNVIVNRKGLLELRNDSEHMQVMFRNLAGANPKLDWRICSVFFKTFPEAFAVVSSFPVSSDSRSHSMNSRGRYALAEGSKGPRHPRPALRKWEIDRGGVFVRMWICCTIHHDGV